MRNCATQDTPDPHLPGAPVRGVLLDIDETLVDLYQAMREAMVCAGSPLLPGLSAAQWDSFAALYMADPHRYYDRYVDGEFSFSEQRGLRARAVFEQLGITDFDEAAEQRWITDFERAQPRFIKAFPDVVPFLDALDEAGIPYGAVSNNVHDYQRAKLDMAGLARIHILVGIDTVNVAKPHRNIFLEGCRQLGIAPAQTLYVGDNFMIDGVGAAQAGLQGVWLNRDGKARPGVSGSEAAVAARVMSVHTFTELNALVGARTADQRL